MVFSYNWAPSIQDSTAGLKRSNFLSCYVVGLTLSNLIMYQMLLSASLII